ncbi:hypothetical protein C9374_002051 [Naegleria lovaniensis]|uniref:MT-A70 family protein n=1 Tax=Naegleria lovaniensis TaxID=51637 RepID=A0AA88GRE4_NAELO|nr:uncharacterized protein C9374_002051 [Naegleria lovaniensis]KAG2387016.1 hypothetical protein C9374_002051 [Naegleria lovaniensis]
MSSRPSRSASLKSRNQQPKKVPSSSYYLGYVEDDETIEMIMQKFEELEKLQQNQHHAKASSSTSSERNHQDESSSYLDEAQQEELFKRTSHHSIQSNIYADIMRNFDDIESEEEGLAATSSDYSDDDADYQEDDEEAVEIVSDDNFEECVDEDIEEEDTELQLDSVGEDEEDVISSMTEKDETHAKRTKKKRKTTSQRKSHRKGASHHSSESDPSTNVDIASMLLDPNMNFLKMIEKASHNKSGNSKKSTSTEIVNIPTSNKVLNAWAKIIQPIDLEECELRHEIQCPTMIRLSGNKLTSKIVVQRQQQRNDSCSSSSSGMVYHIQTKEDVITTPNVLTFNFKKISKNGPFEGILIDPPYDDIEVEDLKKLPLDKEWFIQKGYCFIWVEKEFTVQVIKIMKEFDFDFVDSMCWVREELNQSFSTAPSNLFPKSKLSLFIFRKKNSLTKSMHLKHQRNADVVFDFKKENPRERPSIVFHVIETLLFSSNSFLELWGEGCYKHCKHKTPTKWTIIKEIR